MTTNPSKNVFNIAVDGNFDDCQKLVKEIFSDDEFSKSINMSGVNSINWARIVAQTVYYFFCYFKLDAKKYFIFCSYWKFWRCLCWLSCKENGTSN